MESNEKAKTFCFEIESESSDLKKEELMQYLEKLGLPHDKNNVNKIRVLWHKEKEFYYTDRLKRQQDKSRKNSAESSESSMFSQLPTLHISTINHFSRDKEGNDEDFQNIRYHRYFDSSIWNYYYSFEQYYKEQNNPTTLYSILEEIAKNYERGLYELSVAQEYGDLQLRLVRQSYLVGDGGHANAVSPFLFHSEKTMKDMILYPSIHGEKKTLTKAEFLHKAKWRFLLVDDHDVSGLTAYDENGNKFESELGKVQIIINDLRKLKFYVDETNKADETLKIAFRDRNKNKDNTQLKADELRLPVLNDEFKITKDSNHSIYDYDIIIDCVKTVAEAKNLLLGQEGGEKACYDIILLDYKLSEKNGRQEYGYKLLRDIKEYYEPSNKANSNTEKTKPSPNGAFYFMFISAYTTAVQERLQMEGFYVSKDYWFLGRGACPTNTPYLFLYSLKRMMDIRYEKITKHRKKLKGSLNEDLQEAEGITMAGFLQVLFSDRSKTRMRCVDGFNAFLSLRSVYDKIKYDLDIKENDNSSMLVASLFPDNQYCTNSFWEHLQNLIYLTAFGTIRQWPEMWEDYMFVKNKLMLAEKACKIENKKPSDLIRNYILKLKNQS